jgi:hypothetical protein
MIAKPDHKVNLMVGWSSEAYYPFLSFLSNLVQFCPILNYYICSKLQRRMNESDVFSTQPSKSDLVIGQRGICLGLEGFSLFIDRPRYH